MKKSSILIVCIVLTIRVYAQPNVDCIGYNEFYLLKTNTEVKGQLKIKASELKSNSSAEQVFGTNYTPKKYIDAYNAGTYNSIEYKNGLTLNIPENNNASIKFKITSSDYTLYLSSGQSIKVGMKSENCDFIGIPPFFWHNIVYVVYNTTLSMIPISLQQERAAILQEMAGIDQMIRGHVSEQSFELTRHGKTIIQGPYYILQRREEGKNNCQRVPEHELDAIVAAVEGHQRFQTLATRYAALTEQMTWNNQTPEVKKKFRRFWRSSSPKRPPA